MIIIFFSEYITYYWHKTRQNFWN